MGTLNDILKRAESWPKEAQEELEKVARDIENELSEGVYTLNESERAGVERGLHDSAQGKFASPEQVEAVFEKYRNK